MLHYHSMLELPITSNFTLSFNNTNINAITLIIFFFFINYGYFWGKKWYTTDIFRTWMHFLRVNVTFYDTVNMIHDVIRTATPFPCTAKFMFIVDVRNDKAQQIKRWKINRIRTSISVGTNDNFLAKARKLPILPTSLDIFIYGHTIRILYILMG